MSAQQNQLQNVTESEYQIFWQKYHLDDVRKPFKCMIDRESASFACTSMLRCTYCHTKLLLDLRMTRKQMSCDMNFSSKEFILNIKKVKNSSDKKHDLTSNALTVSRPWSG